MRRPRRHPRIRHEPGNRIILYYVKRSKVIRQSPVSRGGQTGCAARFDCADASHVARLRPDRYLLGGRQGWNKADPSPRPSKSGHPRQRVAHAPHHDVDAIDHVRSLGGVAERAQQGGHAEPDGEQRVAMSGCSGNASVMSSLSALPWGISISLIRLIPSRVTVKSAFGRLPGGYSRRTKPCRSCRGQGRPRASGLPRC